MKISYYKVNPGGNTTAILKGKISKKEKLRIARKILKCDPSIEQVGFWIDSKNKNIAGRLEMAGGEFCGNALRAFGAVLFKLNKSAFFLVESSGTKEYIQINATQNTSAIALPLKGFSYENSVCSLPGIRYLFANFQVTKGKAKGMLLAKNLLSIPASGVIGRKKSSEGFTIKPIVWVRDVATFFEETACGSGTMALAFSEFMLNKRKTLKIKQPSGAIFSTKITRDSIRLSGPILSIEEKELP